MTIRIGTRIKIKDNAYEGSDDPSDFLARGKLGVVVWSFGDGTWEIQTDDDEFELLADDEIEELEEEVSGE